MSVISVFIVAFSSAVGLLGCFYLARALSDANSSSRAAVISLYTGAAKFDTDLRAIPTFASSQAAPAVLASLRTTVDAAVAAINSAGDVSFEWSLASATALGFMLSTSALLSCVVAAAAATSRGGAAAIAGIALACGVFSGGSLAMAGSASAAHNVALSRLCVGTAPQRSAAEAVAWLQCDEAAFAPTDAAVAAASAAVPSAADQLGLALGAWKGDSGRCGGVAFAPLAAAPLVCGRMRLAEVLVPVGCVCCCIALVCCAASMLVLFRRRQAAGTTRGAREEAEVGMEGMFRTQLDEMW